jgi:peptidyl-prolyl cis-trans isomerase SurA
MVNFSRENESITSKFLMKDLPAEIAKKVADMNVGDVSKAFIYTNTRGQQVCAIIKLKSRVEAHRATITDDFQVLKELVLDKRRSEKLNTWIKNKQKSTYIRINPEWRNCNFQYPDWLK